MRIRNIRGSLTLTPTKLNADVYNEATPIKSLETFPLSKVYFMQGTIPSNEVVLKMTEDSLKTDYADDILAESPEFDISTTFDVSVGRREIRNAKVDALDIPYKKAGTIAWACVVIKTPTGDAIIVTPSIGQWGSTTDPIKVDNLTGAKVDGYNKFNNFNIRITNKR